MEVEEESLHDLLKIGTDRRGRMQQVIYRDGLWIHWRGEKVKICHYSPCLPGWSGLRTPRECLLSFGARIKQ